MPEVLSSARGMISAAKENPLALVALLMILAAWVVIALKVRRNKELLQSLEKLPETDRLKALEAEMGHLKIKGGLSAKQWLRHRAQQYYFAAFALVCLLIVILAAIAWFGKPSELKPGISSTLNGGPNQQIDSTGATRGNGVEVATVWGARQMSEDGIPPEQTVLYESRVEDGITHIRYRLPYLDGLRRGGPIRGVNPLRATFKWRFPELSINVVNNTKQMMVLSQAVLTIRKSEVEEYPLLLVDDLSVSDLVIRNEGWADASNAVLQLTVDAPRAADELPMFALETNTLPLGTLGHVRRIPIGPLLPERLRSESVVSIAGRITYDQAKRRESVNFDTRVSLQVRTAAGLPASHSYNAFFKAGQAPVKVGVGIAQQIPTGDADRFLIVLGTDKTSRNQIQIDFLTAGGEKLSAGEFWIDVFAPRSASEPWTVSSQR